MEDIKILMDKVHQLVYQRMHFIASEQEKLLFKSLELCNPPVKGTITKGKIKWRGLRMCVQNTPETIKFWVEQRGIRITEIKIINNI